MGFLSGFFDSESTSVSEPWYPQRKQLIKLMERAGNNYQRGKDIGPYRGPAVTPFNQLTRQGMRRMERIAKNNPYGEMARKGFRQTMNDDGSLDYTNEAQLGGYFDQARKAIDSQFAGAGRYGSGLHKAGLAEEFGQIAQDFANQERDRQAQSQMNADNNRARTLGLAPQLQNAQFQNPENLMKIGGMREGKQAQRFADKARRHSLPYTYNMGLLGDLKNLTAGSFGGYSQTTQGQSPFNVAMGIAGTAMGIPGMGSMFGGGGGGGTMGFTGMSAPGYGSLPMPGYSPFGGSSMPSFTSPMTNYSFGGGSPYGNTYGW